MSFGKDCVDCLLRTKKVVVISKTGCPYCVEVKQTLASYKIKMGCLAVLEIDTRGDGDEIQDYMEQVTGARTVPRVFIDGVCVGGGDETAAAHESGELKELLLKAGAIVMDEYNTCTVI